MVHSSSVKGTGTSGAGVKIEPLLKMMVKQTWQSLNLEWFVNLGDNNGSVSEMKKVDHTKMQD